MRSNGTATAFSAYVADGKATIRTRNGHDWTARCPSIARDAAALKVRSAVLDGEAVVLDERGRSSFAGLQADLDMHGSTRAALYALDLLFLDGEDLRDKPLEDGRLALAVIVPKRSAILLSGDFTGAGANLFRIACKHELGRRNALAGSTRIGSGEVGRSMPIGHRQSFRYPSMQAARRGGIKGKPRPRQRQGS